MAQLVSLDTETLESLRDHGIKATLRHGETTGTIRTTSFVGHTINAARVQTHSLATWESKQPENSVAISISESGNYGGQISSRTYQSKNNKTSFVSLPGEQQKSLVTTEETCGWLININNKKLVDEWNNLLLGESEINLASEAFEGYESFLLTASQHLLWLKQSNPSQWRQESIEATQVAIMSFAATRMIDFLGVTPYQASSRSLAAYVDEAMSFMETSYTRPLSLGDVCEACHVSARTIQIAFRDVRGETPMQALRKIRLEKMRSMLIQGVNVTLASSKVGLSPTGRTAALYASVFGEKPSQTSERSRSLV